ncbi:MAG: twitching motility protein PilT [Planctomycetes bacterium RBG_16_55_9]|nr:MAG: twitching motility protein PilT [Planctomycetes bacterium RBG_16_55_9]
MDGAVYVLDANVFIEAARRYYAFDIAPSFWESLVHHAANGQIQSIDRIKKELERGKDELAEWATSQFSDAFVSTDKEDIIASYTEVMEWVYAQDQFSDAAKADFADGADGWLVAYARSKGHVVVTHEVLDPGIRRKVPIPNVCNAFGVRDVDTFKMLRELKVRFS